METQLNHLDLNAKVNLPGPKGRLQLESDALATRQYFLDDINQNTVFFHTLEEKLDYLVEHDYYEKEVLDLYDFEDIKALYQHAYAHKFRFQSFVGALTYYKSYTLKTKDGSRYLERYEDRVVMCSMFLAQGDVKLARDLIDGIISGALQPATPTFLNAGRKQRGELVSCFLIRVEDNMESIGRSINDALQLSKRGGGVALCLTNLREEGAPIKGIAGMTASPVKVMKLYEDAFSYADQLGARQGAGAVYMNVHHPDIMKVLDTKRENADEKIRIKTLSIGLVITDIMMQLAEKNQDFYQFSPYDVERVYGVPFSDISITEKYQEMVLDSRIKKTKLNARHLLQTIAELNFESGYPYIMFEDTVNSASPIHGRVSMSNLCSEILQVSTPSTLNEDLSYMKMGEDISCNLASANIKYMMASGKNFGLMCETAVRGLTTVTDTSNVKCVPSIHHGNSRSHAIGLGTMNFHGFIAESGFEYDSKEAVEISDMYHMLVNYHTLVASNKIAVEKGKSFEGFKKSNYADGSYFNNYVDGTWKIKPQLEGVIKLFADHGVKFPSKKDWEALRDTIIETGLYHRYRMAVAPTGSISYINGATACIHPVMAKIEVRKNGTNGRVYFPAPGLTNENQHLYKNAYEVGYKPVINVYAAATKHIDQGASLTLGFPRSATTRDINRAQAYAWKKKIKTIYYVRIGDVAIDGCESCSV